MPKIYNLKKREPSQHGKLKYQMLIGYPWQLLGPKIEIIFGFYKFPLCL